MNLQPWLAESWEQSEDGLTWTFHLRQGVLFSNGREMTAEDVKWSYERLINPETGAGNAARVGAHLQARLRTFVERFDVVGDVRGVGLMAGIEMVADKARRVPMPRTSDIPARVAREAYRRGAMVRISGPNMILSPPLVITREEVDFLVDTLEASFAAVAATP